MTAWCHLPTIFNQRRVLRIVGLLTLCVALTTTLFFSHVADATPGGNNTISFQGRLQYPTGGNVADGYYNIQFKIYQGGTGTTAGNGGITPKWTENYVNNNGTSGVQVKNGYFSVNLGSVTAFGSNIDWNDDTIWLSMNIGGKATNCTTFGSGPCAGDGEMLPMQRMTAVPYALNAGALGGKSADNFVQMGQGVQTDNGSASSIYINKTGSGNLIQLQNNGKDNFTVSQSGDLTLGNDSSKSITLAPSDADTSGQQLTLSAGDSGSGTDVNGGTLVLSGGSSAGTSGNGGDIILTGGTATGGGSDGLVILSTPTFKTTTSDTNCYAGGVLATSDCTVSQSSVDSSSAIVVGFSTDGHTVTLPQPTNKTAGRLIYLIAASDSHDFSLNYGGIAPMTVHPNTAAPVIWSGTSWAMVGGTNSSLQDAYNNSGSSDQIVLNKTTSSGGITLKDSSTDPVDGKLFTVSRSGGESVLSVGSNIVDYATNGGAETDGGSSTTFPTNTWIPSEGASVARTTATAKSGNAAVAITTVANWGSGATNVLQGVLKPSTTYSVSADVRLESGSFTDLGVIYTPTSGGDGVDCTTNQTIPTASWLHISCSFTTPSSGIDASNSITIGQASGSIHTFYVDNLSISPSTATSNVKVGSGTGTSSDPATLFTLDKSASAPAATSNDALLGSMYYDTTLGKVQCYEADGWGSCGASPDNFVTMSPEYPNAIVHGSGTGTMSTDLCSDTLNINDGSSSQPTICGTHETYNFYHWTTTDTGTAQTRSIFVTYQLPSTFKQFVAGSTSLLGRTDSSDASVNYQVYRDDHSSGLAACGTSTAVSTGSQSSWQKVSLSGSADPSTCSFAAGDSIIVRIDVSSKSNANAYVSNLNFTYSNQ